MKKHLYSELLSAFTSNAATHLRKAPKQRGASPHHRIRSTRWSRPKPKHFTTCFTDSQLKQKGLGKESQALLQSSLAKVQHTALADQELLQQLNSFLRITDPQMEQAGDILRNLDEWWTSILLIPFAAQRQHSKWHPNCILWLHDALRQNYMHSYAFVTVPRCSLWDEEAPPCQIREDWIAAIAFGSRNISASSHKPASHLKAESLCTLQTWHLRVIYLYYIIIYLSPCPISLTYIYEYIYICV